MPRPTVPPILVPLRAGALLVPPSSSHCHTNINSHHHTDCENILPYIMVPTATTTATASRSSSSSSTRTTSTTTAQQQNQQPTPTKPNVLVLGRVELLQTLWQACGCCSNNDDDSIITTTPTTTTRKRCRACTQTTDWVKRYLPRVLLRLETRRIRVKKNAASEEEENNDDNPASWRLFVSINSQTVYPVHRCVRIVRRRKRPPKNDKAAQQESLNLASLLLLFKGNDDEVAAWQQHNGGDDDDDDWLGPIQLYPNNDVLQLHSPEGKTTQSQSSENSNNNKVLEFRVVAFPERPRSRRRRRSQQSLCRNDDDENDDGKKKAAVTASALSIAMMKNANGTKEQDVEKDKSTNSATVAKLPPPSNSDDQPPDHPDVEPAATRQDDSNKLLLSSSYHNSNKSTRECPTTGPDYADGTTTTKPPEQLPKNFVLYFVRKGTDMTDILIDGNQQQEGLKAHVLQRGAVVMDTFDRQHPPTHLVVSPQVRPASIAKALGFLQGENTDDDPSTTNNIISDLEVFMGQHGITCALRSWAARGNRKRKPAFQEPTMLERYMGLRPCKKQKKTAVATTTTTATAHHKLPRLVHNQALSDFLLRLSKLYQSGPLHDADEWRAYSFSVTAGRVRCLDFSITEENAAALPRLAQIKGFGESTLQVIREYLETGHTCTRLQELETDPQRVAMRTMMKIWGVGRVKATELVQKTRGYSTIAQVQTAVEKGEIKLDRNQYIGLLCYNDILEDMDRSEVEGLFNIVDSAVLEHYPSARLSLMGSYRRGKPACGDADILITHPDYQNQVPPRALGQIVDELRARGQIAHHLTLISGMDPAKYESLASDIRAKLNNPRRYGQRSPKYDKMSMSSYMGVFNSPVVPGKRRRVDIKWYPYRERVFAALYFTGNGYFNRAMRLWATRKFSYTLNDHGLFQKDTTERVMEADSEEQVFDKLQMVWKEVTERDCFDAVQSKTGDGKNATHLETMDQRSFRQETREHAWIR